MRYLTLLLCLFLIGFFPEPPHFVGDLEMAPVNRVLLSSSINKAYPYLGKREQLRLQSRITKISKSVCLITTTDKLLKNQPKTEPYGKIRKLKNGEPFATIPAIVKGRGLRNGTGFLIGNEQILTARHVIREVNLSDLRIIFNYTLSKFDSAKTQRVRAKDVYKVKRVVNQGKGKIYRDRRGDWCVLELDRVVNTDLKFKISGGELQKGQRLVMIGHPDGMPLTASLKGKILSSPNKNNRYTYRCSLDSFHGNSGSPVFTFPNLELVGLYVVGYPTDTSNGTHTVSEEDSIGIKQSFISIKHLKAIVK